MVKVLASIALLVGVNVPAAWAQSIDALKLEKEREELETAIAKAKADRLVYEYGAAIKPKTGDVQNAEKLVGMAQQHAPRLGEMLGEALAVDLGKMTATCPTAIVVEGQNVAEKMVDAQIRLEQLQTYEQELGIATAPAIMTVPAILAGLGAISSIAGLFKSDYAVQSGELALDVDWITAAMLRPENCQGNNCKVYAVRYPNMTYLGNLSKRLQAIEKKAKADSAADPKDKTKEAKAAEVAAFRKTTSTTDDSGVSPLYRIATLTNANATKGCVVRLTAAKLNAVLLTKESGFGKGGKAYLNMPAQVTAIVSDSSGRPAKLLCKQVVAMNRIELSKLTGNAPSSEADGSPWALGVIPTTRVGDCGAPAPK